MINHQNIWECVKTQQYHIRVRMKNKVIPVKGESLKVNFELVNALILRFLSLFNFNFSKMPFFMFISNVEFVKYIIYYSLECII